MEIFVNRSFATLASGIDAVTTTLPLTTGHGARFGTIAVGNRIRIVFLDATLNVSEVAYITGIIGDTATILRAQDGTTGVIHLAGDRIEARIGKSTLDVFTQKASAGTDAIAEVAAATAKATPIDTDLIPLSDSAATFGLKSLSWANLKATLAAWTGWTTQLAGTNNGTVATTAFVTAASAAGSQKIANAGGWGVTPSGTNLFFSYNGVNVAKLDSAGNLTVAANITAYGTV